jgi:hypothetical protein
MKRESSESDEEETILFGKRTKPRKIQSDSSSSSSSENTDADSDVAPPPLPVDVPGPILETAQLLTLPCNSAGRNYIADIPYELFKTADASKKASLDPAPVIGLDRKAIHLSFEIASWDVMWNGLNKKTKDYHEDAIAAIIKKEKLTRKQIEDSGPKCCGITLQIGDYWYSLACLYTKRINVANAGPSDSKTSSFAKKYGLQGQCRGCKANHNTLNRRFRCTFDIEECLKNKARNLKRNNEWSHKVSQGVSYSLVLRILRNGGFLFIRNQADIEWIMTDLTPKEKQEHLEWILSKNHLGFRTGAEMVLLSEAGMDMISFDRTISYVIRAGVRIKAPIDSIGQTIVADSWAFNRLSNDLDEAATDALIEFLLAGDYSLGDAAFNRRNGDGQRDGLLSPVWEASIVVKWNSMSLETRLVTVNARRTNFLNVPDIRIWKLDEFQRLCRLNSNIEGNMVDEVTGVELSPNNWSVDRVINEIVPGISGHYQNSHCIITHKRLNDMKESGGRKVFASVDTLNLEKQRRNIVEPDDRLATITILRDCLDQIRIFRSSQTYYFNQHRLKMKKFSSK